MSCRAAHGRGPGYARRDAAEVLKRAEPITRCLRRRVDTLYVVVSYTRAHGRVIRPGLSLVAAYRLVERLGRGAVFRSEGMSAYSRPVYPTLPRQTVCRPAERAA